MRTVSTIAVALLGAILALFVRHRRTA